MTSSVSSGTVLVHLVWAPLGAEVLAEFAASYRRNPAGAEHRLVVIFNGFDQNQDLRPWRRAIEDLQYEEMHTPTRVLDLPAYGMAVERFPAARYCFLNSYSVIRAAGWLNVMQSIASSTRVGAVGATGSWASQSSYLRYELALGGPYRRVFPDRVTTIRTLASLSPNETHPEPVPDPLRGALIGGRGLLSRVRAYASFPSPHLRSNGFLIDREAWLNIYSRDLTNKGAAYRFESGRRGMTARLRRMGLEVLVAGRDGRAYESSEWASSRTFWQGSQENLLVEDNQTRSYEHGDMEVRRALSGFAWGRLAEPDEPLLREVA
jgi:hypothetical protein